MDIIHLSGFCPSEFPEDKVNKIAEQYLGHKARLLCGSKSRYKEMYPLHLIVFNANVFMGFQKIWYGDLDLDIDVDKLYALSKVLSAKISVTYEWEGRFGKENGMTKERLDEIAVWDSEFGLSKKAIENKIAMKKYYDEQKELSICDKCWCMTKKINGKCGKCGYKKRKRRKKWKGQRRSKK